MVVIGQSLVRILYDRQRSLAESRSGHGRGHVGSFLFVQVHALCWADPLSKEPYRISYLQNTELHTAEDRR